MDFKKMTIKNDKKDSKTIIIVDKGGNIFLFSLLKLLLYFVTQNLVFTPLFFHTNYKFSFKKKKFVYKIKLISQI